MRRVTFDSGPYEGKTVDWGGWDLVVPVRRPVRILAHADTLLPDSSIEKMHFRARQDDDGRWWYVRRP